MTEIHIDEALRTQAVAEIKQSILKHNDMLKGPPEAGRVAEEMANTGFKIALELAVQKHQMHLAAIKELSAGVERMKDEFRADISSVEGVNMADIESWLERDIAPMLEQSRTVAAKEVRDFIIFGLTMSGIVPQTAEQIVDRYIFVSQPTTH